MPSHRSGRADDDGPRASRAVRLPAARGAERGRGRRLDAGGAVRAPGGARGGGRAGRLERDRRREAAALRCGPWSWAFPSTWSCWPNGSPASTARRSPVRSALVLPPGAARRLSGRRRRAVARPRHLTVGTRSPRAPELTRDQQDVLDPLIAALAARRSEQRLLHGVTGSGKTEIYLRAAAAALEQGRGAIVLVPEIALTPQIVGRFIERFGDTVAVLHSRLRPAERYAEWRRLREGEAQGLRGSALGRVRADRRPRPDRRGRGARRLLQARGRSTLRRPRRRRRARDAVRCAAAAGQRDAAAGERGAPVLLRACPAAWMAVRCRTSACWTCAAKPRACIPSPRRRSRRCGARAGKAIVLLNRRGWSNFLSCRSCGRVWSCPDCDVALVLHRTGGYLACHHCGHREPAPARCGDCSSMSVARHGAGTERLADELARVLDDGRFPVFRLDADAVAAEGAEAGALLRRFEAAEAGVLIGTQMVAKGHDFPDVTLGVVLDADATLRFPDFRAEERTFALIAQLAGRVGRGSEGRVLVQTIAPQARSIVHAAAARLGRLPRRRARAPAGAQLPALLPPDQDRLLCRGVPAGVRRRERGARASRGGSARPCSARRRCSGCAAASARCSW